MTFMVTHHGIVYEKDLGLNTTTAAPQLRSGAGNWRPRHEAGRIWKLPDVRTSRKTQSMVWCLMVPVTLSGTLTTALNWYEAGNTNKFHLTGRGFGAYPSTISFGIDWP
jgi:Protein of unknown function (DUF2950)